MKVFCNFIVFIACLSLTLTCVGNQNFHDVIKVKNCENKVFDVVPISTLDEFNAIPHELGMDCRVRVGSDYDGGFVIKDNEECCSTLQGIEVDYQRVRSQLFSIKDGSRVIGIATLLVFPYSLLYKDGYLHYRNQQFHFISIKDALNITDPETFIFELGWIHLLPEYRHKKLGKSVLFSVLAPFGKKLLEETFRGKNVIGLVAPQGQADPETNRALRACWQECLKHQTNEPLSVKIDPTLLGLVHQDATFTVFWAQQFGCEPLPIYHFSLGQVFVFRNLECAASLFSVIQDEF